MPADAGKPPISFPASAVAGDAGTWSGTRPPVSTVFKRELPTSGA